MKDLTVIMEDQPGKLADLGEATGKAGVNIEGACAMVGDGKGFIHLAVKDAARPAARWRRRGSRSLTSERPWSWTSTTSRGRWGRSRATWRTLGVNIDVAYTIFTGVRLVILTEDVEAARQALKLGTARGLTRGQKRERPPRGRPRSLAASCAELRTADQGVATRLRPCTCRASCRRSGCRCRPALEAITTVLALEQVAAVAAVQPVLAAATDHGVLAGVAEDQVGPGAGADQVGSASGEDLVVALVG